MNPINLIKALLFAGVFALAGIWAMSKAGAQLPKVRGAF